MVIFWLLIYILPANYYCSSSYAICNASQKISLFIISERWNSLSRILKQNVSYYVGRYRLLWTIITDMIIAYVSTRLTRLQMYEKTHAQLPNEIYCSTQPLITFEPGGMSGFSDEIHFPTRISTYEIVLVEGSISMAFWNYWQHSIPSWGVSNITEIQ